MGRVIPVTVRDKIATAPKDALYVCGNSDFSIEFDFDEEWSGTDVKTARFVYNGRHQDKVFEGSICPVPVLSNTHSFKVGVYAGNLKTTTSAWVPAKKSILCGGGSPAAPSPDVYAQIMEKLNAMEGGDVSPEEIAAAVEAYMQEHPAGGVTPEELTKAVEAALEKAKESGEFKGDPGDDYILTDADKKEIAGMIPGGGIEVDIAKITTGGEYVYVIDQMPDGDPLNLVALRIDVDASVGGDASVWAQYYHGQRFLTDNSVSTSGSNAYTGMELSKKFGQWEALQLASGGPSRYGQTYKRRNADYDATNAIDNPTVTKIHITNNKKTTGTVITVRGVPSNA